MLGEVEEAAEHLQGEVFPAGALQHEADHQEASVLDHMLLYRRGTLYKLTDEPEQFGTGKENNGRLKDF